MPLCLWLGACFLVHLVLNLKHTRKKKDGHVLEVNADACFLMNTVNFEKYHIFFLYISFIMF